MTIHALSWEQPLAEECRGGAVTIGNFDGVHRGHQALLTELSRQARRLPGPAVAVTFDPHPLQLLRPAQFQPVLTTIPQRALLLQQYGADHVVILHTTPDLLHLSARQFFERVLRERLDARRVVPGFNFAFGHNREGNVQTLETMCHEAGSGFTLVPPLASDGRPVSSSRIRDALLRGEVRAAAGLLGRPYRLEGIVGMGQRRGKSLGFPTANLEALEVLVPGNGVYAVRVEHDGQHWPGAAHIGPNATFGEQARTVEVHLIGFSGDLYGATLALDLIERIRDTRPFPSAAALVEQLRLDVEKARGVLTSGPGLYPEGV
jgi:riboflavin kinase/FMN adenylyltransferase